jgi:hypothetical protein
VNKLGVGADGNDFRADFFKAPILLCQSSKFGRSDKGEVGGIEEKNGPFALGLDFIQADHAEVLPDRVIDLNLKGGNLLPYPETCNRFTHIEFSSRMRCLTPVTFQHHAQGCISVTIP